MAATDPSPFAVTRRHAEAATGIAMRDWNGPHLWIRAWHQDLTLIETARRGALPASLATELAGALGNEATRSGPKSGGEDPHAVAGRAGG